MEGRKESETRNRLRPPGRVRLLLTLRTSERGYRSDKTHEVLLSGTRRKPVVIFSVRALARPRSRRGLVPTPGAVIFAELPSLLGGDLPLSFSTELRVLSPYPSQFLFSSLFPIFSQSLSLSLSLSPPFFLFCPPPSRALRKMAMCEPLVMLK